jgi:hypothetical protein
MNRSALRLMALDALKGVAILAAGALFLLATLSTLAVSMDLFARLMGYSGVGAPVSMYYLAVLWFVIVLPGLLFTWYAGAVERASDS